MYFFGLNSACVNFDTYDHCGRAIININKIHCGQGLILNIEIIVVEKVLGEIFKRVLLQLVQQSI